MKDIEDIPDANIVWLKFRKKPVVIEAYKTPKRVKIITLEGTMTAEPGDWIVKGVKGERYPVKPDIFEMTYEPDIPEDTEV